jgi:hypothetical protein
VAVWWMSLCGEVCFGGRDGLGEDVCVLLDSVSVSEMFINQRHCVA